MDELKRLIGLIAQRGNKSSPLINQQDENSLETKLFNLIKQGKVESDEDAVKALYNDKGLPAPYRMLKSRMRKKLMNHLHFLDFPADKFSIVNIESYKIHAVLLEAQSLITANEFKIADKLLTQSIAVAKSNHLTPCIVRALEQKINVYSSVINKKAYLETSRELQYYYEIEAQERTASGLYHTAMIELGTSVRERNEYLPQMVEVLDKLQALWLSSKSSHVYGTYHILSIAYLELQGDFKAISEAVGRSEQLLKEGAIHPIWINRRYNAFISLYALLRTREYKKGLALAKENLPLFDAQTYNWFAYMENYLLLALHAQRYALAGELLQQIAENGFFHEIQQSAKERWELYRKYLVLVSDVLPSRLRLDLPRHVFIELVTVPKDKAGFNLSLLVLDTIKSFSSSHIDDYESQAERIRKYIVKYMRGEKAERPKLFLRLLLLVIKKELDFEQIKEASLPLSEKLRQADAPGDAFAEVEIVPYEHLWETVLIILKRRRSTI